MSQPALKPRVAKVIIVKPLLKWVGGKTQIIDKLINKFPNQIENYNEIFLGGGSVLFALLSHINANNIKLCGKIYAFDFNYALIAFYINVQTNHLQLYNEVEEIKMIYLSCPAEGSINRKPTNLTEAKSSRESYYYWIRSKYNTLNDQGTVKASAIFIFLNKMGFRGMFREGPNGFNIPYGHYKNTNIINKQHLITVHQLIQKVLFRHSSFETSFNKISNDDFVYLDPPYAPENETSFVGYTKKGFKLEQHKLLFKLTKNLSKKNVKFTMSNSNVDIVNEHFPNSEYNVEHIMCRRAINAKKPQSKTKEVIIQNWS